MVQEGRTGLSRQVPDVREEKQVGVVNDVACTAVAVGEVEENEDEEAGDGRLKGVGVVDWLELSMHFGLQ